ncbi:MAG TPA: Hsp20/alpha crystallin family protein [Terriglobales bacterium]|jgi:HSP20 family molecular chaperone IbpA|nr:Hsp20/alpha crystallin family protein [Terriglobales bacterium]
MARDEWDILVWRRANDLLQQAERIHRNFLQVAADARYRAAPGRTPSWEPPVNVVETDTSMWVIAALPGVARERMDVRLDGRELVISGNRPMPQCCEEGELKIWEMPLGRFERRLRLVSDKPVLVGEVVLRDGLLIIELRKQS